MFDVPRISKLAMNAYETDLLSELIGRKHKCLTQLRDMTKRQLELIRAGTMPELLDVLRAKQRVLGELQGVEQTLEPFRSQDPNTRRWRTPELREQCARQLEQCGKILADVVAQEKQSEQELTRRRDGAAVRLQGAHDAEAARKAYTTRCQPRVGQIDVVSED